MLNEVNKEKVREIKMINQDQKELCKFILKGQKIKKKVKGVLIDTINNIDSIYALDNLSYYRALLYNTIPTYKNNKEKELSNYDKLYIDLLNIIKEYIQNDEYRFMFRNDHYNRTIYCLINDLSGIMSRFSYEDIKYILKCIKDSGNIRINEVKTYLRLCNYVYIEEKELNHILIDYIKDIKDENKQLLVNKVLRNFYSFSIDKNAKGYVFRLLDDINECKDDNKLNIIDRFLEIIYNKGYLKEENKFNKYFFGDILDVIESDYNNKNINIYLDLLNEDKFINSNNLGTVDKAYLLRLLLHIDINEESKQLFFDYIKQVILQCKNEELRKYFIKKIEDIKYNKSYEWLIEFYPIIIKYGDIAYQKGYIDELTNIYDNIGSNDTVQKKLTIQIDYKKDDLK